MVSFTICLSLNNLYWCKTMSSTNSDILLPSEPRPDRECLQDPESPKLNIQNNWKITCNRPLMEHKTSNIYYIPWSKTSWLLFLFTGNHRSRSDYVSFQARLCHIWSWLLELIMVWFGIQQQCDVFVLFYVQAKAVLHSHFIVNECRRKKVDVWKHVFDTFCCLSGWRRG